MKLRGRTALVTGAASGIGRGLALVLAERGCHLALCDVNEEGLRETVAAIRDTSLTITTHRLDVSDAAAVAAFPDVVRAQHPRLDLLVNNAGVALGGTFEQVSEADFDWLFSINFFGVVRMTRAFLPMLKESDDARLVNISSIFGIIAIPGQATYAASKFAVRGLSEALRHELAGTSVGVTVVHPGGVATSIADSARTAKAANAEQIERDKKKLKKMLRLSPVAAAESIVRAVEQRRPRVIVGSDARLMAFFERLMPVGYWKVLSRLFPK
jgi:short-subunit dehydrogenase